MSRVWLEVMNPVAAVAPPTAALPAARLSDLHGKKIGLWWNTKARGQVALAAVQEALEKRFKDIKFVKIKQNFPHAPNVYDPVSRFGCDAVIATSAD